MTRMKMMKTVSNDFACGRFKRETSLNISKWAASYKYEEVISNHVVVALVRSFLIYFPLTKLLRAQALLLTVVSSEANYQVLFEQRAWGGRGSSIMLLIITGSNCTFTPGYWQSSLKQANNGVSFWLPHTKQELRIFSVRLCVECQWLGFSFLFLTFLQNLWLPSWQEVILSCHLVTTRCFTLLQWGTQLPEDHTLSCVLVVLHSTWNQVDCRHTIKGVFFLPFSILTQIDF